MIFLVTKSEDRVVKHPKKLTVDFKKTEQQRYFLLFLHRCYAERRDNGFC